MIHDAPSGGTLVLDPHPGTPEAGSGPTGHRTVDGAAGGGVGSVVQALTGAPSGEHATFRSPELLLFAASAIYLGYCSLGVIAGDGSHWAAWLSSRPGALVEGAVLGTVGLVLARPLTRRHGPGLPAVAWGAMAVLLTAVVVAATGSRAATDLFGVAELLLAAVAAGTTVAVERRRRVATHPTVPTGRSGSRNDGLD